MTLCRGIWNFSTSSQHSQFQHVLVMNLLQRNTCTTILPKCVDNDSFFVCFFVFFIPDMTALKCSTANSKVCSMQSQNCKAFLQQTQSDNKEVILEPSCKLIIEWRNEGKNRCLQTPVCFRRCQEDNERKARGARLCGARQAPCCDRRCNFSPICTAISTAGQQRNRLHKHSPT